MVILACLGVLTVAALAKAVVVPTLLAVLLALALAPVATGLERLHVPEALAAIVTVLMAATGIVVVTFLAAPRFTALLETAPAILEKLALRVEPFTTGMRDVGDATKAIGSFVGGTSQAAEVQTVRIAGDSPTRVLLRFAPGLSAQFFYTVLMSIFILAERRKYRIKLISAATEMNTRLCIARIIRDMYKKVSGYLFVVTAINTGIGVATAVTFFAFGLPDPVLWGVLFGVANFVPVVGVTVVIVASALVGLALHDSLVTALAGAVIMTLINAVEGNIIQPLIMARRMVVNPVALLLSFAVFSWMWGAAAAVLSVPIIVCIAVIARHAGGMGPLATMLTNETPTRGALIASMRQARMRIAEGTSRSSWC